MRGTAARRQLSALISAIEVGSAITSKRTGGTICSVQARHVAQPREKNVGGAVAGEGRPVPDQPKE